MPQDLPNINPAYLDTPDLRKLDPRAVSAHPPRILMLFGSLRPTSYSRLLTLEAERILRHFGPETRAFDPHDLPLVHSLAAHHPNVPQLRKPPQCPSAQLPPS